MVQEFDAAECMAGSGRLTRVLRKAGLSVASMDILYWPDQPHANCSTNPLDMLSASGFAPLGKHSEFHDLHL